MNADDGGFGLLDATFGDRESGHRRVGDEVEAVRCRRGTHGARVPFGWPRTTGITPFDP
jgi:hypothetical protein